MSSRTSFDALYLKIGNIVQAATGREWWRKAGIQAQPSGPYATVYIEEGTGLQHQVVESVELDPVGPNGEIFQQTPWGATHLDCKIEFYRDADPDTALVAAMRFRNSLRLEERFWDLWEIAGLVGNIRLIDVSGAFRADIEPRTEIRFNLYANIVDPLPLIGNDIYDIQTQEVTVKHVQQNETETDIVIDVDSNQ